MAPTRARASAYAPSELKSSQTLPMALVGVWLGQIVRRRLKSETFRFWFFVGILGLGLYLMARIIL